MEADQTVTFGDGSTPTPDETESRAVLGTALVRPEPDWLDRPASQVAPELLGWVFTFHGRGGRIVETEAYEPADAASHSFRGRTPRNGSMFGAPGTVYVYRSYGIHWCANIVCRSGSAVLLRAVEPTLKIHEMRGRRGPVPDRLLCAGPGRLSQALGIDENCDGMSILAAPFRLQRGLSPSPTAIGPRIGITKAADRPWRFGIADSPFLSRPFPKVQ